MEIKTAETVRKFEPNVVLPDKKVKVVIADHGEVNKPLPNRGTIEDTIFKDPEFGKLSAIAPDGVHDYEENEGKLKITKALNPNLKDADLDFEDWFIRLAAEKNIPLISADPARFVTLLPQFISAEEGLMQTEANSYINAVQYSAEFQKIQQNERDLQKLNQNFNLGLTASGLALAAMVAEGVLRRKKISRRGFMGRLGFGAVVSVLGIGGSAKKDQYIRDQREHNKQEGISLIQNAGQTAANEARKIGDLLNMEGEITDQDRNNPEFKRLENLYLVLKATVLMRNAIAAEALAQPIDKIIPGFDHRQNGEANVATIWGNAHSIIDKRNTISELLKNEEQRKRVLDETVQYFISNLRGLLVNGMGYPRAQAEAMIHATKEEMKQTGRTFTIAPDGKVTTHTFPLPNLNAALARVR